MKNFLVFFFLLGSFTLKAQHSQPVDTSFQGKITVDKTNKTKIFLTGFKQELNTDETYTTTYFFGARISRPVFDVNIGINFSQPLIKDGPLGFQYAPYGVGKYSGSGGLRNNDKYLFLQGQMTATSHHFYIKIKTKEKPEPTITGLDGQAAF